MKVKALLLMLVLLVGCDGCKEAYKEQEDKIIKLHYKSPMYKDVDAFENDGSETCADYIVLLDDKETAVHYSCSGGETMYKLFRTGEERVGNKNN